MYCTYCGATLPDGVSFCPHCGKPPVMRRSPKDRTDTLVESAREGKKEAVSALYEQTYSQVFYTVKSMIKDEDAVFDILQDSYLKAFTHLDSFRGNTRFLPWMRQIAANTARDWLKKQKPLLFSDLAAPEESDSSFEDHLADDRETDLPEYVVDQAETKRLLQEIIEELPADQRAVIGMYYYEEMSVKEIAQAMGATENAVKSRLLYGRRKIETKVRELEKKGTKLYGLAPIPFLLWLLKGQETYAAQLPDAAMLQNILRTLPSPSVLSASGTVRVAATAAKSFSGIKAAAIGIAAIAVIGGTAFGIIKITSHPKPAVPVPAALVPADYVPVAPEIETADQEENAPLQQALGWYRTILSNADSYDFGEYAYPNGKYLYALEYMNTEDPVPSLLLCQCGDDFIDHIRVFCYDPSAENVIAPEETLSAEVAESGGLRSGLGMMEDGNGICITAIGGMRGDVYVSRATLTGEHLITEEIWTGFLEEEDPSRPKTRKIIWYDTSDLSGFDIFSDSVTGGTTR